MPHEHSLKRSYQTEQNGTIFPFKIRKFIHSSRVLPSGKICPGKVISILTIITHVNVQISYTCVNSHETKEIRAPEVNSVKMLLRTEFFFEDTNSYIFL